MIVRKVVITINANVLLVFYNDQNFLALAATNTYDNTLFHRYLDQYHQ